jgi:hypothetical protein
VIENEFGLLFGQYSSLTQIKREADKSNPAMNIQENRVDTRAFHFSLTHKKRLVHKDDQKRFYSVKNSPYGFSTGHIVLSEKCNEGKLSKTEFGTEFEVEGIEETVDEFVRGKESPFRVKEIECFQVIFI